MARHISVATAIEKNKIASEVAFVMLLDITIKNDGDVVEHLYLAKNSENVVYRGQTWQAANFNVKYSQDVEADPTMSVDAQDPSGFIRERMEAYNGGIMSDCTMIVLNTGNLTQEPEVEETFMVTGASINGYSVSFTLGVENPLHIRFPRINQFRDQCPYTFKGERCRYVGAASRCSFTYDGANGCLSKGNQINFGGFRGLQSLYIR